ncbi:MAG: hypothetical protein INF93_07485 [Rhodobacter sp.]|nr:hypothetical protein [Rhodobacter sp.]
MPLPKRAFVSLAEAAGRWGCQPADIAEWASLGNVEIVTGIAPVRCGSETIGGFVVLSAADILPMFRRCGKGPSKSRVRRFRVPDDSEWKFVTEPSEGVIVALADLVILKSEVRRFEAEYELFRAPHGGKGPERKYDWDAFYVELIKRVHFQGVPEKQAELVEEMTEWFGRRSDTGDGPDSSTVRKRVAPVWRMLKEDTKEAN